MTNPLMYPARVSFADARIADIEAAVRDALDAATLPVRPAAQIAVAVGSRGIASIDTIVRTAVAWLRARGAEPFIIPAMGSHGGATADGQRDVLASYGITEATVGAPVRSSMETVAIDAGATRAQDAPGGLFMDRLAWESDGVLLINRIKPHTDFHGFPESGLLKMSVIGLGKHAQALAIHGLGIRGLKELILPAARRIIGTGKIVGGLAIVENAYDKPMRIEAAPADRIETMERELLAVATDSMARLPIDDIDLLIVDEMGKDKSGTGLDTNVIGRIRIQGEPEPDAPRAKSIVVTRLTAASHGNAIGIGLVDAITRELSDAIDFGATYENGLTSSFSERIKLPYVADTHEALIRAGIRFAAIDPDFNRAINAARIVRIRSTLDLSEILVSAPVAEALATAANAGRPAVAVGDDGTPLLDAGRLAAWGA